MTNATITRPTDHLDVPATGTDTSVSVGPDQAPDPLVGLRRLVVDPATPAPRPSQPPPVATARRVLRVLADLAPRTAASPAGRLRDGLAPVDRLGERW